jgi:phospholipid/cholesterol/gamma-HCH transport system substrate-binding protein
VTGRLSRSRGRVVRSAVVGVATLLATTACGVPGLQDIHLPGGGAKGPTMQVTVVFDNVQDLVPQASVRSGDVVVGEVSKIDLGSDLKARVTLRVARSVKLPANTVASVQETSLLGEKFVALDRPTGTAAQGALGNGAVITTANSETYPATEEVFGLLASVLNGGGLEKVQTIAYEVNQALAGREQSVRDLLTQLNAIVGNLDGQKSSILRALDAMDTFSANLSKQTDTIALALDGLAPGIKVLADERANLTALLTSLGEFGTTMKKIVTTSGEATKQDLALLQPILQQLAKAGSDLPNGLELLPDYPFPKHATDGIPGDYTNLHVKLDACSALSLLGLQSLINSLPVPILDNCTTANGAGVQDLITGLTKALLPNSSVPISQDIANGNASRQSNATPTPSPSTSLTLPGISLPLLGGSTGTSGSPSPSPSTSSSQGGLLGLLTGGLL